MDERKNREREDIEQDLLAEMERDADVRRATNVRNALGPVEDRESEMPTAESDSATERGHSGRSRSDRASRQRPRDEF